MRAAFSELSLYTKRFFSAVFLSRISGLGRDLAMAFAFGDHISVAAFFVAFRLSNLLRRLLGEGPFQAAFIPHFEELRLKGPKKANTFFRQLVFLIATFLLILTVLVEITLITLLSFSVFSDAAREIVILTAWLFPAIIFICLYGLNISLLQCCDIFFVPNFAPFICNAFWIAGALFLKQHNPQRAMIILSQFVVVGFIGQWLMTLPLTLKQVSNSFKNWLSFKVPAEVKALFKSFAVSAIGVGALQINAFIDTIFARYADLRGPVYLWYSIRLEQLALAVFGIACINTIVPRLSRAIKKGDLENGKALFALSYKRIMVVMLPCFFAILALGAVAVNLLYGRGHFSTLAISQTVWCLWSYSLGLLPSVMVILFSALFYAHRNFRLPTMTSVFSVFLNIGLNGLFVFGFKWGASSIALATGLSAAFNFWFLQKMAAKDGWKGGFAFARVLQLGLAAGFGFLCVFLGDLFFFNQQLLNLVLGKTVALSRSFSLQLFEFVSLSCFFVGGLIFYTVLFKNRDLQEFFQEFFLKRKSLRE